ncbi:MAG: amidohydrolase family protein [Planctomycetota bacterium]
MSNTSSKTQSAVHRIAARWIWSGAGAPRAGTIAFESGRILEITDAASGAVDDDFGHALIVPGFVNAHVHLDLTLAPQSERLEIPFTRWLLSVRDARELSGPAGLTQAAIGGVELLVKSGTTTLVDYDSRGFSLAALASSPMRRLVLREVIALRAESPLDESELEDFLDGARGIAREERGLAPHAPYTVRLDALKSSIRLARRRRVPWSMHIAEQPDEARFIRDQSGSFAEFLAGLKLSTSGLLSGAESAVLALERLGLLADRPLLVHGNYLTARDIAALAAHVVSVVYCPRSHAWFGHAPHPLEALLATGVNVALGTDGLISNGALSMLAELRAVRAAHPRLTAERVLALATTAAHTALDGRFGSGRIALGEPADFAVIALPRDVVRPADRVLDAILAGAGEVCATYIAGDCVYRAGA